jgi:hypothetical protein
VTTKTCAACGRVGTKQFIRDPSPYANGAWNCISEKMCLQRMRIKAGLPRRG